MTDKGSLIVVSGPSGSGKGTILNEFNQKYKDEYMTYSISATTRSPREGEMDGINYYFITTVGFLLFFLWCVVFFLFFCVVGFLEYAKYCENYYGTPKKAVMDALNSGIDVILEIETVGAMKVKKNYPEAILIFILPPSVEELRARLIGRGTETADVIETRLAAAKIELALAGEYDYVIVNDRFETAASKLNTIILSQRLKTINNKNIISEVCKNDLSGN